MDLRELVGRNVRRLRRERGFTQEQLAEVSELGQQYISDLERGRCNATLLSLEKLAAALSVQPVALFEGEREGRRIGEGG